MKLIRSKDDGSMSIDDLIKVSKESLTFIKTDHEWPK